MIETSQGIEVADAARLGEEAQKNSVRQLQRRVWHKWSDSKNEDWSPRRCPDEYMIWDRKVLALESELTETCEEMKGPVVKSGKVDPGGQGFWMLAKSVQVVRWYPEPIALKVKVDLLEVENKGAQASSGSVLTKGLRLGTKVPGAVLGVSQKKKKRKKKKTAVRKEWAEAHEYGSCQQKDMEELSFVPSTVSDSAAGHEPRFVCDRQCRKEGFTFNDIVLIRCEDDGKPHTINLCMDCYNSRQDERKEPGVKVVRLLLFGRWRMCE